MGYLNQRVFYKHGCFGLNQLRRTFWYEPTVPMDILNIIKFQGPFDVDQMSLWTFLERTK